MILFPLVMPGKETSSNIPHSLAVHAGLEILHGIGRSSHVSLAGRTSICCDGPFKEKVATAGGS
jgi:hypothetical protein